MAAFDGTITFEDVAKLPRPASTSPSSIGFSPDDSILTYLRTTSEDDLSRQLFSMDVNTMQETIYVAPPGADTEENLSLEEKLRRERQRLMATGIQSYTWIRGEPSCGNARILVPLQGNIFVQDYDGPGNGMLRQVFEKTSTGQPGGAIDPTVSPDGSMVAFVQNAELYVAKICAFGEAMSPAVQVTSGARGMGKMNGLADFIAQEEMDRYRGYWWSPDSKSIAFEQVDESHIPIYRILHQGKEEVGQQAQEDHRYPFAGAENPHVKLGVVNVDSKDISWMDLGSDKDIYLARVDWMCDGTLTAQIENRSQTVLDLMTFDINSGHATLLLKELSTVWINLHNLFTSFFRPQDKSTVYFLWGSERSGFMQLYLYQRNTGSGTVTCANDGAALTMPHGVVECIAGISVERNVLYFYSTGGNESAPPGSDLYATPLFQDKSKGTIGCQVKITKKSGYHVGSMNRALTHFVDISSSINSPPVTTLNELPAAFMTGDSIAKVAQAGAEATMMSVKEVAKNVVTETWQSALRTPSLDSFKTVSGHELHAAVYQPDPAKWGDGPYPCIVCVYGGPHVQLVKNNWNTRVNMRAQSFCSRGYVVLMVDNRGSARRGLSFEGEIYRRMGTVEVEDQVAGVKWLITKGLADANRIGVYGWSYGGYMSLMCLMQAPEVFHVAVSGAPVTHWDGYDTHYTERYMGLPTENATGYKNGSVMEHVKHMKGDLMLIHGLIDENVHARHSFRLINAMIAARKPYHLFLLPNERHSPRSFSDRVYMEEQIFAFFQTHLGKKI